ncbi:hypothetical protein F66182_5149 [Fusarium sp. NRRL 66182]|nr:hypothetical protein F66182_5149 [Fusarium sp. NRRL 66182]
MGQFLGKADISSPETPAEASTSTDLPELNSLWNGFQSTRASHKDEAMDDGDENDGDEPKGEPSGPSISKNGNNRIVIHQVHIHMAPQNTSINDSPKSKASPSDDPDNQQKTHIDAQIDSLKNDIEFIESFLVNLQATDIAFMHLFGLDKQISEEVTEKMFAQAAWVVGKSKARFQAGDMKSEQNTKPTTPQLPHQPLSAEKKEDQCSASSSKSEPKKMASKRVEKRKRTWG